MDGGSVLWVIALVVSAVGAWAVVVFVAAGDFATISGLTAGGFVSAAFVGAAIE